MIKIFLLSFFVLNVFALENENIFQIQADKTTLYVGETFHLTFLFHYKNLEDYELPELAMESFATQELNSSDYKDKQGRDVEEINFACTPNQAGVFEVGNLQAHAEKLTKEYKHLNNKSKFTQKFTLKSNSLQIKVQELPQDVQVIGEYQLYTKVNSVSIKRGEPLFFTLILEGQGNIKDLDFFTLSLEDATSYLMMSSHNKEKSRYTKTYKIVANHSYTIPSFSFKYFDKKLGVVQRCATSLHKIHIDKETFKEEEASFVLSPSFVSIFFFVLFLFLVVFCIYKKYYSKKVASPLLKNLQKTKNSEALYKLLVPYLTKNRELDRCIFLLEDGKVSQFRKCKKKAKSLVKMMIKSDIITADKEPYV